MSEPQVGDLYTDRRDGKTTLVVTDVAGENVYVQKVVDGLGVGYKFVCFSKRAFKKHWEPSDGRS